MAEQNTTPVTGKKRKLPSFMTAPTRIESSKKDAHEQKLERSIKSPKPKHTPKPKVTRKQTRQTQLPLQRTHRPAKTPAQDHLSQQQRKVLNTSDAVLVEQCKAILSRGAATTGAAQTEQQTFTEKQPTHDTSTHTQPQVVCVDVMDAETQLLEMPTEATLVYKAVNHPEMTHSPASHSQHHKDTGFALPAAVAAPDAPADVHNKQQQPVLTSPSSSLELSASANAEPAGGSQLSGTAAEDTFEKQPLASISAAVVPSHSVPAATTASNHGGGGMSALLQAMLTGELTS